jgi:O-antigen/teichoic acid export membrane protein
MTTAEALHARGAYRRLLGPGAMESLVLATSLLTGPLVSRRLGADGRGSLAAVVVPVQLIGWTLLLGVPYGSAMLLRHTDRQHLVDGAWRVAAMVALPVCVAAYLLAGPLLDRHSPSTIRWFQLGLTGVVLAIPAATALQLRVIVMGGSWRYSLARSLYTAGYAVAIVTLAVTDRLTLRTALASWIGTYIGAQVVLLGMFRGMPRAWAPWSTARRQLRNGRAQAAISLATTTLGRVDQLFLGVLATSSQLGAYAVAATAVQFSLPVAKGIADVVMPDAFANRHDNAAPRAIAAVLVLSTGIGALSAALAPWLLPAVFGAEFSASVRLLWLMIPGQVCFNTAWVISAHRLGSGRPGRAAVAIVAAAVVYVALLAPAIAWFGPEGAAALTSLCQLLFLTGVLVRSSTPQVRA